MRINIRKAGSLVATGLACAGVIATALLAVKKAPEVQEAVEDARSERSGVLNPIEVIKAAAPSAWPVCAAAAGTIACIVGIQAMNQKQQASLVAMYGIAAKSLKKYDGKIKELFGEDAPAKVKTAIAQDTVDECPKPNPVGDACTFYDMISGRYFTSTMLEVRDAEYHFNRKFVIEGGQAILLTTIATIFKLTIDLSAVLNFTAITFGGELVLLAFKRVFARKNEEVN